MKRIIVLFVLIFLKTNLFSQSVISPEVIASSGGFFETSSGITYSWTLGEIVSDTYVSSELTFTQGFQQEAYSFSIDPNSIESSVLFSNLSIYPNPFTTFVNLRLDILNEEDLELELCSSEGKKLLIQKLENGKNVIYLPYSTSELLILKIVTNDKIIASHKLIRIQK